MTLNSQIFPELRDRLGDKDQSATSSVNGSLKMSIKLLENH